MFTDSIFDNIISPKFMGSSLKVHPAAVLLTAVIAANIIGFIGLIVAGPVLATLQLLGRYILRKMFDLDPWEGVELISPPVVRIKVPLVIIQGWSRVVAWPAWQTIRIDRLIPPRKNPPDKSNPDIHREV
jgi:hypothetical protein